MVWLSLEWRLHNIEVPEFTLSPHLVCFQVLGVTGGTGVNIFVQIRVVCWVL